MPPPQKIRKESKSAHHQTPYPQISLWFETSAFRPNKPAPRTPGRGIRRGRLVREVSQPLPGKIKSPEGLCYQFGGQGKTCINAIRAKNNARAVHPARQNVKILPLIPANKNSCFCFAARRAARCQLSRPILPGPLCKNHTKKFYLENFLNILSTYSK